MWRGSSLDEALGIEGGVGLAKIPADGLCAPPALLDVEGGGHEEDKREEAHSEVYGNAPAGSDGVGASWVPGMGFSRRRRDRRFSEQGRRA